MITYFQLVLFFLLFPNKLKAFNTKNNACGHYYNYPFWFISNNCYYIGDYDLGPPALIEKYGFKGKEYEITTKDGYISKMFRILPKTNRNITTHQPVILMHGLAMNCLLFLMNGNDSLAEAGYDVWLPNLRATKFSSKHQIYSVNSPKYWDYGLDDLAEYDVKKHIKFVAEKTQKSGSIIYIGHSLGTTTIFMLLSENREIQSMLKGVVAISPVVYLNGIPKIQLEYKLIPLIFKVLRSLQITGLRFQSGMFHNFLVYVCRFLPHVCLNIIELFCGDWSKRILPDNLLQVFAPFPQGVSFRQLFHLNQMGISQVFEKFNYGKEENYMKYGQPKPPIYNLNNITIPVFLYSGMNDIAVSGNKITRILFELGSKDKFAKIAPDEDTKLRFNHLDFLFGRFIRELFYNQLLDTLAQKLKD